MSIDSEETEWEFDERRGDLCSNHMIIGEELVWWEADERFDALRPPGTMLKKTLRRTRGGMTFLVQDSDDKVLTVGTMMFTGDKI